MYVLQLRASEPEDFPAIIEPLSEAQKNDFLSSLASSSLEHNLSPFRQRLGCHSGQRTGKRILAIAIEARPAAQDLHGVTRQRRTAAWNFCRKGNLVLWNVKLLGVFLHMSSAIASGILI